MQQEKPPIAETEALPFEDVPTQEGQQVEDKEPAPAGAPAAHEPEAASEPAKPEDTVANELRALQTKVDGMLQALQTFSALIEGKIAVSEKHKRAYEALYGEMMDYKEKFLYGLQRPLLNDLLMLYDTIEKQVSYLEGEAKAKMSFVQTELLEILSRWDIEPMPFLEEKVDREKHRVLQQEPTGDPEKDRMIAKQIRRGFVRGDRVFRPEEVVIWRYAKAEGDDKDRK